MIGIFGHQMALRESMLNLVEARQHDPQPSSPALAIGNNNTAGPLKLAVFRLPPQPPFDQDALFSRPMNMRQEAKSAD
jgi:hypothetical protein